MSDNPAKILAIHNYYRERGGEDQVFENETGMLERRGHDVIRHTVHNDSISGSGGRLGLAAGTVWNRGAGRDIAALIEAETPDLVHIHNFMPLISPSAHHVASAHGIPVVQTLHNFRLICPGALLYRNGEPCEKCIGRRFQFPGIVHRCYRGSRAASTTLATMNAIHGALGTWQDKTDAFIALSEFSRGKFVAGGLPECRLHLKPNFMPTSLPVADMSNTSTERRGALFVGRLSIEKGVRMIVNSWSDEFGSLNIVGDGPLRSEIEAATNDNVQFRGLLGTGEVLSAMRKASVLIFPSEWYENMSQVLVEALSMGLPVIASRLGGIPEIVEDGVNGLLFSPGDGPDFARVMSAALADPEALIRMGNAGRRKFDRQYSEEVNYGLLMDIYSAAAMRARERRSA